MKTFVIACAAAIIIAVVGGYVLNTLPDSAANAFSTQYVRLGA
jgi:hypothetical protein